MFGVDPKRLGSPRVGEPGELHDRPACCPQDLLLDVRRGTVNLIALAAEERDLRDCAHAGAASTPGRLLPGGHGSKSRGRFGGPLDCDRSGATVEGAGDVVAHEVLRADAANLPPISPIRRRRKETDGARGVVRTVREQAERKRKEKLEHLRQQLESGSLVIRQMTDEERQRYPPRPVPQNRTRGR